MSCAQAIPKVLPTAGTSEDKRAFRQARRAVWYWFCEVTIFRHMCHRQIFLHGIGPQSPEDIAKMTPDADGQQHAARCLALEFDASPLKHGKGFLGFGRYASTLASTASRNAAAIARPKGKVWLCFPPDSLVSGFWLVTVKAVFIEFLFKLAVPEWPPATPLLTDVKASLV